MEPQRVSDFASLFIGLSQNSNYTENGFLNFWFKMHYNRHRSNDILQFHYKGFPVLQIKKYNGFDQVGSYLTYSVDFYSAFFCLPELQSFYAEFIRKYGGKCRVARVDIACDLVIPIGDFLKKGYKTNFKKSNSFGVSLETGIPETIYFGSKSGKNKRHLFRIYNKLLDSKIKNKYKLYRDYFAYDHVTRVEAEIRSTSCKELGLNPLNVTDSDTLREVFTSLCINPRTTNFVALQGLKLKSDTIRKLTVKREYAVMAQDARFKRFSGMGYNLLQDGFENIYVLFLENMRDRGAYQNREELLQLQKNITNYLS